MKKYDLYDFDKFEKARDTYHERILDIYRRFHKAKEKGNQKGAEKAIRALAKHKKKEKCLKEWAKEAGFYWY
jgi:hypothetical protein